MTLPLFAVLPASVDDPAAPSGGNRYDREVIRRLRDSATTAPGPRSPLPAFHVREHLVGGTWPRPGEPDRRALAGLLDGFPDGALVLLDGLLACGVPDVLAPHATRLRLAVLVHLPLGDETGLTERDAAGLRELESRALRLATAVIATSGPAARRIEQLHGLTGVHVVPPGVAPAPLAEPSPTGHRLLNVAALTPRKGQDLLLAALWQLSDLPWACTVAGAGRIPSLGVPPPATLTLAGSPALGWTAGLPEVRTTPGQGRDEPTEQHTVRFTGALSGAALDGAYAGADLFVLPSRAETYGMVVTEALARGLPVVAAAVGGVPEALGAASGGGIPGRLIPPNDAGALAAALRAWLTDGELREQWREHARGRRGTLTGWAETTRRLAQVLTGT